MTERCLVKCTVQKNLGDSLRSEQSEENKTLRRPGESSQPTCAHTG